MIYVTDCIDYWNYLESITGQLEIDSTFFGSSVIRLPGKPNWMPQGTLAQKVDHRGSGVPFTIRFNDTKYGPFSAKADGDIKKYYGKRYKNESEIMDVDDVLRSEKEYKSYCGRTLVNTIGMDCFPATYYKWLMAETNERVNLGESLTYELVYRVEKGEPTLEMIITGWNSKSPEDKINIWGEEISLSTLTQLAARLGHQRVYSKKARDEKGINWFTPTSWTDINELKNATNITNAVYMWWGTKRGNEKEIYLYIGIVGARSEIHSVSQRIQEEMGSGGIADEFGIDVKQYRYSMINNIDVGISASELLHTVEMQCINNISAIIPVYGKGDESIINPLFCDGLTPYPDKPHLKFADIGDGYKIILINKMVRYRN